MGPGRRTPTGRRGWDRGGARQPGDGWAGTGAAHAHRATGLGPGRRTPTGAAHTDRATGGLVAGQLPWVDDVGWPLGGAGVAPDDPDGETAPGTPWLWVGACS